MNGFLSQNIKITVGLAYASGTADREGAVLDMAGWDGVLVVAQFGAIATGGTNSIKMQQGAAANMSDAADLTGTKITVADDDDSKDKDTSNACAETVTYIQYKGLTQPVAAHGTGVAGEAHQSPAEGTA